MMPIDNLKTAAEPLHASITGPPWTPVQACMQARTPARTCTPKGAMSMHQALTHRHVEAVVAYWAMCLLADQRCYIDNISVLPQGPLPHALLHVIQASSGGAAVSIVFGVGIATWT